MSITTLTRPKQKRTLRSFFPILEWLPKYQASFLRLDAVLSLTVVRMVSVAISLRGIKVHRATTLFLGWFGPRGLASILYIITILEAEALSGFDLIFDIVMITVLLSVFAHGITAAPLANRYGEYIRAYESEQPGAAEMQPASDNPLRAHPEAIS